MSKKYNQIANLSDLADFSDLGDLLQNSGIQISSLDSQSGSKAPIAPVSSGLDSASSSSSGPILSPQPLIKHSSHIQSHYNSSHIQSHYNSSSVPPKAQSQMKVVPPVSTSSVGPQQSLNDIDNCLLCYSPMYMKVKLHCGHEFCLNCIKVQIIRLSSHQPATCPYCNQSLPDSVKNQIKKNPEKLVEIQIDQKCLNEQEVYWFYASEQRGNWWSYDLSSSQEIEGLYQRHIKGEDISQSNYLSICGMTRIFNFDRMLQINEYKDKTRRIRRIEKQNVGHFLKSGVVKGLSGCKVGDNLPSQK